MELATTQLCGECLIDPPVHDKKIVLFRYEFPIPSLIAQLKFQKQLYLGTAFGTVLSKKVVECYENDTYPECIIPVPLHPRRLRQRGYNQALEIARSLKKNGLKIDFTAISRVVATLPQTLIDHNDRQKNVANSFLMANNFKYEHVALLDDVITTGSTINELASTLKKKGVRRVDVFCVAKAM
jgi:ComF family protein